MRDTFTFTSDPGHGWLLVTQDELTNVGLTEADISSCSYRKGETLALEEDSDAGTFLEAYKNITGAYPSIKEDQRGAMIRTWRPFGSKSFMKGSMGGVG